ncbi:TD and POZ domain-containing protein 4, partial [Araneus ventricosus]
MFSNDMKEKINGCVNIEDFNDNTVLRMLRYVYSAEVEELVWVSAIDLYVAADKYQILSLKDVCSSHLKNSLCVNNACAALVLADLHQDEDLKGFVQDFILRHGEDVINSEQWDQLMETSVKLAAETLRLKYKEKLKW